MPDYFIFSYFLRDLAKKNDISSKFLLTMKWEIWYKWISEVREYLYP